MEDSGRIPPQVNVARRRKTAALLQRGTYVARPVTQYDSVNQYESAHDLALKERIQTRKEARDLSYLQLPGPLYVNKKQLRQFLELMAKKAGGGRPSPAWRARGTRTASGWRGRIE